MDLSLSPEAWRFVGVALCLVFALQWLLLLVQRPDRREGEAP